MNIIVQSIDLSHLERAGNLYSGDHWTNAISKKINIDRKRFNSIFKGDRQLSEGVFTDILLALNELNEQRGVSKQKLAFALENYSNDLAKLDEIMTSEDFENISFLLFGNLWKDQVAKLMGFNEIQAQSRINRLLHGRMPIYLKVWLILQEALEQRYVETELFLQEMLKLYPEVSALYNERKISLPPTKD